MMATTLANLIVRIGSDARGLEKELGKLERKFNRLSSQLSSVGKTLTAGITAPVMAATGTIVKFGADFEKAMTASTAIMGDLSDSMRKNMELTAREVAKTTRFSATEAAEAYYFLASAGLDAAQSIEALPRVAAFAQAGNFDLARATDLLTDAQSALGLASKDAAENIRNMTRVSDVLVKANTLANASVEQFSTALTNKAGAALRTFGKDVEEGTAILAVFADQGLKGEAAGTTLARTLEELAKKSRVNRDRFEELGVAVFDQNGEMRNMADIVADLEVALEGMSTEQKEAALSSLGLTEVARTGLLTMLGNSEALREYERELRNAGGTTDEVAQKQLQNFWDQLGLVRDRLVDVALELYQSLQPALMDTLIPALNTAVDWLSRLAEWFTNLDPKWQMMILGAIGLAAAIGPVLLGLAGLIKVFSTVFGTLKLLVSGFALLFSVKALIVVAILAVIAAGIWLIKNWGEIRKKTIEIWGRIRDFLSETWSRIRTRTTESVNAIRDRVQSVFTSIRERTTAIWQGIRDSVSNIVTNMREKVVNTVTGLRDRMTSVWSNARNVVSSIVSALSDRVTNTISNMRSTVQSIFSSVRDAMVNPINAARGMIRDAVDRIVSFFSGLSDKLKIRIPRPKLPRFTIQGEFSLMPPRVPRIGIEWYAKGGVFTGPSVIGVGEAGPEAVVPLQGYRMRPFAEAVAQEMPVESKGSHSRIVVEVPVYLDGREVARATTPYIEPELERHRRMYTRARGER